MNPLPVQIIRTIVPVAVGALVAWLLSLGVILPVEAVAGLEEFIVGLVTAVYYVGVSALERRWPEFGWLLGVARTPEYDDKVGRHRDSDGDGVADAARV